MYGAFLVRYWQCSGDERRLEVTHVQSGGRLLTSSPEAMLAWARAQLAGAAQASPDPEPPAPDQSGGPGAT